MPIQVEIPDDVLAGFSVAAKDRLKSATTNYADSLIEEVNRIEASRNGGNGPPEVTQAMVSDAIIVHRQGLGVARTSLASKILRVVAALLSLFVGVMANASNLQNKLYLIVFILLITGAILAMTISILKE